MTYQVIESFMVKLAGVETELKTGAVISLPEGKAIPLIETGRIKPIERAAYHVYSEILQGYLWVVETDSDMRSLKAEGITEAIYTGDEIRKLKTSGMDKEGLKVVHNVKQGFDGSQVKAASRVK